MDNKINKIKNAFFAWQNNMPDQIISMPGSGSDRNYFRITLADKSIIAVFNSNVRENQVFFNMTNHFMKYNIPVPELLHIDDDKQVYFQQDLGDTVLFDLLDNNRENGELSDDIMKLYESALASLAKMQAVAGADYDYTQTYPVAKFDKQSVMWDLNYFKYYYLKLMGAEFNELALQHDFNALTDFLMNAYSDCFMFRDFQSRNIMIYNNEPYFIDYQGGRQGAPQYDVASLLWQARAKLSENQKEKLLSSYMLSLKKYIEFDENEFLKYYNAFVLIRVLQTLGAYGFRGLYEHKAHFILSLPMAVANLKQISSKMNLKTDYPELSLVVDNLLLSECQPWLKQQTKAGELTIFIGSFSYKKGLPENYTGHGGGHVFDCRAIHNPGRYQEYKQLTGRDQPVIDFLDDTPEMQSFLEAVKLICCQSVEKYLDRGFDHLSIYFGCTGGQHRSVYSAEKIYSLLKNKYPVRLVLNHREQSF